jgi:tRNA pseudouridine55 synthase
VLLVGRATRLSRYVTDLEKEYVTTARFGAVSDTLDAEGEIQDLDRPMPSGRDLRSATERFTGDLMQTPPMASAVKVGGERLYNLHRRGLTVERKSRPVTVHSFELLSLDPAEETATFRITCSSGTYVRTLVADLASSLGTGAYLTALRRTRVGHLTLDTATSPQEPIENHIIHTRGVVGHLPGYEISPEIGREVCNGRSIEVPGMEGRFRAECGGELLAVYSGDGRVARPEVVLCGG